ncbi:MAG TPA: flagellar hook-basal body complex protein FliE [Ignavibacteriaceae bacterium]|jgi:flagellar hook-basal body complex protein FliE|nr:flagellar hook-basal body complex protein FliE [Ignavibacteriaceae bacterium]
MQISSIQNTIPEIINSNKVEKSKDDSFGNILTDFIGQVNNNQLDADNMTQKFVTGGNVEIQDVMIAGEKAKTSLDLLMEIRNKAIDMYTQLSQIQV